LSQTEGSEEMTQTKFRATYTNSNKKVEKYLFNVLTTKEHTINFNFYLKTLSTSHHGTNEEKALCILF
jgi:hypothetical protein